jgi:hypothetical protein
MIKSFSFFVLMISIAACQQRTTTTAGEQKSNSAETATAVTDSTKFTTIQWIDSVEKDLGTVKEGPEVEIAYKFRNTGDKPLIISNVHASCGCTIPETPKEPFEPGAEGTIRATFTTKGHLGTSEKSIYVTANTKESQELKFHIVVEANN